MQARPKKNSASGCSLSRAHMQCCELLCLCLCAWLYNFASMIVSPGIDENSFLGAVQNYLGRRQYYCTRRELLSCANTRVFSRADENVSRTPKRKKSLCVSVLGSSICDSRRLFARSTVFMKICCAARVLFQCYVAVLFCHNLLSLLPHE